MIRQIRFVIIFFVIAFVCTIEASAQQFVPVIADQVTTVEVFRRDGSSENRTVTYQRVFRSSSGAILIQFLSDAPDRIPKTATLIDYGKTLKAYSIRYSTGQAMDQNLKPLKRPVPKTRAEMTPAELTSRLGEPEQMISGFSCVVIPGYQSDANGENVLIGRAWIAPDLNMFMLKEDSTVPLNGGKKMHTIKETVNLTVGVEPDPALFETDSNSIRRAAQIHPPTP